MSSAYHNLVKSGFVGSLKRDVLLEASDDLEYVGAIRAAFADAGEEARGQAVSCAAELVSDLVAKGLCSLASWANGSPAVCLKSRAELEAIIVESPGDHCFDYFVVSTARGDEWVKRYMELVGEL